MRGLEAAPHFLRMTAPAEFAESLTLQRLAVFLKQVF